MPIDFEQFIHPLDRKALHTLQKIPLLDTVLRKYMKMVDDLILMDSLFLCKNKLEG